MQLRDLIERIGATYDRTLPMSSEAQQLLRGAGSELSQWLPAGYFAVGSGGKGNGAVCPWIAVLDPDETTSAQRGMYVVYLFAADMRSATLTLNHGVTEISRQLGRKVARRSLEQEANAIRTAFEPAAIADLDVSIDLRTTAGLAVDYEHANIVARRYSIGSLPAEHSMVTDLLRFVRLYADGLDARRDSLHQGNPAIVSRPTPTPRKRGAATFKPKSEEAYRQQIAARERIVERRHEVLVNDYERFLRANGYAVSSPHPCDLVAKREGEQWLIEAKTVRAGNGEHAAREALGQLLFYRRFLYAKSDHIEKAALFSEDIGNLFTQFFEELNIAVVWKEGRDWAGSRLAAEAGLC